MKDIDKSKNILLLHVVGQVYIFILVNNGGLVGNRATINQQPAMRI